MQQFNLGAPPKDGRQGVRRGPSDLPRRAGIARSGAAARRPVPHLQNRDSHRRSGSPVRRAFLARFRRFGDRMNGLTVIAGAMVLRFVRLACLPSRSRRRTRNADPSLSFATPATAIPAVRFAGRNGQGGAE
jgi:hypothetical protein